MAKTTIDGLSVRSQKRPVVSSAKKSAPKRKKVAPKTTGSLSTDPLLAKAAQNEHYEQADWVDLLGDGPEPENEFTENSTADWSELLTEMGASPKPAKSPDSSLLDDPYDDFFDETHEKSAKNRTKKSHKGRTIVIVFACLILLIGGVFYFWGDGLISKLTGGKSGFWDTISAMVSDEIPFETDKNGRTNVLIFGTEGYNMNGDTADGQHDGAQLTDSIMVASFDQKTKDVALLSLPRDLKVRMACSAGKLNEVFWCHNMKGETEEAGAKALMEQLSEVLGIEFQYYAHVNWMSLISIIDEIGGITLTLDEDINDYQWTGAVAKAGVPITVNGEQALGLARARHGTMGGDFTRGNTQQKIVAAIMWKLNNDGVDLARAWNLLNILGDNVRSNFSSDNIKAGVRLVSGFDVNNIRHVTLADYANNKYHVTTATINEISYVVPAAGTDDYSEIQKYIAAQFNSDPVVREEATVAVYNATDGVGLATAERDKLEAEGYVVAEIGNADAMVCDQPFCLFATNTNTPGTQAKLAERYGVPVHPVEELPESLGAAADILIVIGQQ